MATEKSSTCPYLDPLIAPVENFQKWRKEKSNLIQRELAATNEIQSAAASDSLDNPSVRARLSEAATELTGVRMRLAHVGKMGPTLLEAIKSAVRRCDSDWTMQVQRSAEVVHARFIKANLKFYDGDADAAEVGLRKAIVPGANDWRERIWQEEGITMTEENCLQMVARFVAVVNKYADTLAQP